MVRKTRLGLKISAAVIGGFLLIGTAAYGVYTAGEISGGRLPSYAYRESAVIGKTREEIVEKYGEPDVRFGGKIGYNVSSPLSNWYYCWIDFDENGIAEETFTAYGQP